MMLRATAGAPKTSASDSLHVSWEVLSQLRQFGWKARLAQLCEFSRTIEDPRQRGLFQLYAGWLASERGAQAEGTELLTAAAQVPELEAWASVAQSFLLLRAKRFAEAHALLDRTAELTKVGEDTILDATMAHCRGSVLFQQQRFAEALDQLYAALDGFGPDHVGTGRVLDTLGMIYTVHADDFMTASLFYRRSLEVKRRHDDQFGLALTYGQLGRLCLDWGELDRAEEYFRRDLELCRRTNDARAEAQMYNHLGQVLMARGRPRPAVDHLNESVRLNAAAGNPIGEAYARKDRARALVQLNRAPEAEQDARRAEELFAGPAFVEGMWHARRALALARAAQGDDAEAERLLSEAAAYFDDTGEAAEAARTWLELAARAPPRCLRQSPHRGAGDGDGARRTQPPRRPAGGDRGRAARRGRARALSPTVPPRARPKHP